MKISELSAKLTLQSRQPIGKLISNLKRVFCLKTFVYFRRFIQRYNMKQHIKTHRIELLADQKTGFPIASSKKGRFSAMANYQDQDHSVLDMSN